MSLFTLALEQIQMPPWQFAASSQNGRPSAGYYTPDTVDGRKENRRLAEEAIRENGPMTVHALAERIGIPYLSGRSVVGALVSMQILERRRDGSYQLKENHDA